MSYGGHTAPDMIRNKSVSTLVCFLKPTHKHGISYKIISQIPYEGFSASAFRNWQCLKEQWDCQDERTPEGKNIQKCNLQYDVLGNKGEIAESLIKWRALMQHLMVVEQSSHLCLDKCHRYGYIHHIKNSHCCRKQMKRIQKHWIILKILCKTKLFLRKLFLRTKITLSKMVD